MQNRLLISSLTYDICRPDRTAYLLQNLFPKTTDTLDILDDRYHNTEDIT